MYISQNKIVSKFVEKLLKYRILVFGHFRTCCRDALPIKLYFVFLGISIPKIRAIGLLYDIKVCC